MVVSMEKWKGKVAVVTGASSGIGAAIAEKLVEEGLQVVGLARCKEKIDQLSKKLENKEGKLHSVYADVTKEEDILNAFIWVKNNLGPIHILINNAGVMFPISLIEGATKLWKDTLDTNVLGLCIATREAVKDMRVNKIDGHIIHMNSTAGHSVLNIPNLNVYSACDFAVTALTETLRQELNSIGSKIKITSISPGQVNTNIYQHGAKACGIAVVSNTDSTHDLLCESSALQPSDVADAVLYVLATPSHVQVHELIIKPVGEVS